MRCLVTGGGGFLGRYLVEQLLGQGEQVRILCRGKYPALEAMGVEVVQADIRDAAAVQSACEKMEAVFHVAAIPGVWGDWQKYYQINTVGTENIINACQKQGVQKLVYTSSPSVVFDGNPHLDAVESLPYPKKYLCHYPHSKAIAEQAVLQANNKNGLLTCALRPHLIWGPRDNHLIPRLLQKASTGKLRQVGTGANMISMCYVENAAAAHWQAADKLTSESRVCGQAYFINDPVPVKLWEWINVVLIKADLQPLEKKISAKTAYRLGYLLECLYKLTGKKAEPPMTRFVALQLSQSHTYSIEKASRDFQYKPIIDYATSMKKLEAALPAMLH